MDNSSGVGVLDKSVAVLTTLESGPASLAQLVAATGLARPTAHRLAVALERHRLVSRDAQGRFVLGPRLAELATAAGEDRLLAIAQPILIQLRDLTGESAQLYRRQGDSRICVAAAERATGLRDTVPVGSALPMTAGSAAQVLLAWDEPDRVSRGLRGARFTATSLAQVRRRGCRQRRRARGRGGLGVRPGARPGWQDHRRRLGLRAHRAPDPLSRPAARRRGGRRRGEDHRRPPAERVTGPRRTSVMITGRPRGGPIAAAISACAHRCCAYHVRTWC
jgi:DNA-binding IclR family transcriptional regulator